jgi:hypothetical protein
VQGEKIVDPAVTQLLAEKLGLTAEEFESMGSGDLSSLLGSQSGNPLMGALLQSMLQSSASEPAAEAPSVDYEAILLRARARIQELKEEVAVTRSMVRYIADVFGACPLCWGQHRICPRCDGRGRPGSRDPIEEEMLDWVVPALRRRGMRIERTG